MQSYKQKFNHPATLPVPAIRNFIAALLLMVLLSGQKADARSSRPPANLTGAPPQNMTCANCHTGVGNGTLSLVIDGGLSTYVPGQTYPMEVVVNDPGQERFGFSMVARSGASKTTTAGSWTAGLNSTVFESDTHIGHSGAPFADNTYTFNIQWTAPSQDVGEITFYASANAANGDGSNGAGDNVYAQQLTISAAQPFTTFWPDSPVVDGWRITYKGYPETYGVGIINDTNWPVYFTYDQSDNPEGDWIYVIDEGASIDGYWAYNLSEGYFFYAFPSAGWYYSLQTGSEGWFPFGN